MATTKNITMKQFNGTDYDILYPKTVYNQVSGVAPAGYGLGSDSAHPPEDDADKCLLSGWYASSNMSNAPFTYCLIRVDRWYSKVIFQTAYQLGTNVIARRCTDNGNWLAWEYVNPPMELGVEYRTTERYLGKPVYVRLVDCGNMPSAGGSKTVQAPYEDTTNQMRYAWIYNAHLTYHGQALPSFIPGEVTAIRAAVSTTGTGLIQIIANGNTDWSDANAKLYVSLKYIKITD